MGLRVGGDGLRVRLTVVAWSESACLASTAASSTRRYARPRNGTPCCALGVRVRG